jgi:hypothetical protein
MLHRLAQIGQERKSSRKLALACEHQGFLAGSGKE